MLEIPRKNENLEVFPSKNASLLKKFTIKVGQKYYDISESMYQLLQLIDNKRTLNDLSILFSNKTGKTFSESDIKNIIDKNLINNNIVFYNATQNCEIKNESYLFIKLPFLNSKTIEPVASFLKMFYKKQIMIFLLTGILFFHLYLYLFSDIMTSISIVTLKTTEIFFIYLILFITTLFHELGHSSACAYIGANLGSIGIGLYLNMPVFYADVTDIWRFKRTKRILVDIGGVYFQLLLIPIIFLIYLNTSNNIFLFTIFLLDFSIVSSLNPILRFDGYWIATDISGIPNLRERSKELFHYYVKIMYTTNNDVPTFQKEIPKKSKYFLIVYSLLSNLIFAIYIYIIITYLPSLFSNFISFLYELFFFLKNNSLLSSYTDLFSMLNRILPTFFFITMLLIIIYRIIKKIIVYIK